MTNRAKGDAPPPEHALGGAPDALAETPGGATAPGDAVAPSRLATSQLRRLRRIVDAAVELAQQGGFEAVRLRDVAESSGVALGTLYRYFRSKEDILVFALSEEMEALEEQIARGMPAASNPRPRLAHFFETATGVLTDKPHFARAVLRAVASGEPETTTQVAAFHLRIMKLTREALRPPDVPERPEQSDLDARVALILSQVWFASLVGWAAGLHTPETVLEQVDSAAALLLEAA